MSDTKQPDHADDYERRMGTSRTQELLLLGQIHGLVQALKDGQDLQNRRMDQLEERIDGRLEGIDGRLRHVEQRAAVAGALTGGAVAIGCTLMVEGLKNWLHHSP